MIYLTFVYFYITGGRQDGQRFTTPIPPQNFASYAPHQPFMTQSQSTCNPRARSDFHNVEVFKNKTGNIGILVNGQKFRRKRTRKDMSVVWLCNRNECTCTAVTTPDHCIVSLGLHNHTVSPPVKEPSDSTTQPMSTNSLPTSEPSDSISPPTPQDFTTTPVQYVESERGKQCILYRSYKYYHRKDLMNYTMWRCMVKNCHAYVRTAHEQIIHESGSHIHEPLSNNAIKKLTVKATLRQKAAKCPDEKPAKVISNALRLHKTLPGITYDGDVSGYRTLVRHVRRKVYKKVPKTKEETLRELKELAEENDELVKAVEKDIVFIARDEDIKLLSSSNNISIFADGTFQYSPKHFKQMLTFFIFSCGFYIPICHFLLQNKLFTTYKNCIEILSNKCTNLGFQLS